MKFLLSYILLFSINLSFAADNTFLTSIEKIEEKLKSTPTKRLIIGGLHTAPNDMKEFWKLSEENDIVINCDSSSSPDILWDVFHEDTNTKLLPLATLLNSDPSLQFNEIIFEHVGSGHDLLNLFKYNQLSLWDNLLALDGKFVHQSFYMPMKPYQGILLTIPEEETFRHQFGIKKTTGIFKGLDTVIPEKLIHPHYRITVNIDRGLPFFTEYSLLKIYMKILKENLAYTDVKLKIETPKITNQKPQVFAFRISAKKGFLEFNYPPEIIEE